MCDEEDDDNDNGDIQGSEASDLGHCWTGKVQNYHCKVIFCKVFLQGNFLLLQGYFL